MRITYRSVIPLFLALILILSIAPIERSALAQSGATFTYLPLVRRPGIAVEPNYTLYNYDDQGRTRLAVVGEVENNTDSIAWETFVSVRLLNGSNIVQTTTAGVNQLKLLPGQRTCFRADFTGVGAYTGVSFSIQPGVQGDDYTHDIRYGYALQSTGGRLNAVDGTAQNFNSFDIDYWFMSATVYNTAGAVTDCALYPGSGSLISQVTSEYYSIPFKNPNLLLSDSTVVLQPEGAIP